MCPDQQLISIYMDEELPSPWKEKIENHMTECPVCREKFENFWHLRELLKKSTDIERTIAENVPMGNVPTENVPMEQELIESAKERVWQKLDAAHHRYSRSFSAGRLVRRDRQNERRKSNSSHNLWERKLSIPIPALAAAAAVIVLFTTLWIRGGSANTGKINYTAGGYASIPVETAGISNLILAAEEEIPVIPTGDINSILKLLSSDRPDIIIIQLPESRSFNRSGEPAIIKAADNYNGEILK